MAMKIEDGFSEDELKLIDALAKRGLGTVVKRDCVLRVLASSEAERREIQVVMKAVGVQSDIVVE
jgi:hypothetical protein